MYAVRRKHEAVVNVDGSLTDTGPSRGSFSAVREALAQATAGALVLVGIVSWIQHA